MKSIATLPALLLLAACGGGSEATSTADKLDQAAEQSDPAAAAVLENAADQARESGTNTALGAPGSPAQDAMNAAGNAQAATVGNTAAQ